MPGSRIFLIICPWSDHLLYKTLHKVNQSMVVSFTPFSGLFNQSHYIPLSFLPLEIELELINRSIETLLVKLLEYPADNGVSEKFGN